MAKEPVFSIIMPVHDMAEYLNQSLTSWTSQTFADIEILCVDDASADRSLLILNEWADRDNRVKVFSLEENGTAWMARKCGMEHASGKYIMFADADDTVLPEACEELYAELQKDPVDILHFDAEIVNLNGLPDARVQNMQRIVAPLNRKLYGEEVLLACFEKNDYGFTLWNKVFSGELCRQALPMLGNAHLPKGQDKLLYFILAYCAHSYRGLPGKRYYQYYFGRGGTGQNRLSLKQFERYCTMARVAEELTRFLQTENNLERFEQIDRKFRRDLADDCVSRWYEEIAEEEKCKAFDLMLKYWNAVDVSAALYKTMHPRRDVIGKVLQGSTSMAYDRRPVRTIAAYYHTIANGGAQRVVCQLANLWVKMGYSVVVITDKPSTDHDYFLHESVQRCVIPDIKEINEDNYDKRAAALQNVLMENQVDVFVNHAWVCNLALWDELVCKLNNVAYIAHCHSVFSIGLLNSWDRFLNYAAPFRLADATVTLSMSDQAFWRNFSRNVFNTQNPMVDDAREWECKFDEGNHNILWVGRMSAEKNLEDALQIIQRVHKQVPDARLHIVGGGNREAEKQFRKMADDLGIQAYVEFHGFQKNVRPFYEKASIFLMTSSYEGAPLSLCESKLAGLPCVMYELPYLAMCEGNRGIVPVSSRSVDAAAEAVADLLKNPDKRYKLSQEAREHAEEMMSFDLESKWNDIFGSLIKKQDFATSAADRLMIETLLTHQQLGLEKMKKSNPFALEPKPKLVRFAELVVIGCRCLKEKGFAHTLSLTLRKINTLLKGRIFRIDRAAS